VFWKFQRTIKIENVDRRVQTMEVSGQDILAKDKVGLRVNLTALWQVEDVVQARASLQLDAILDDAKALYGAALALHRLRTM
jgi:regulator of protease activity HflC (stomatin/prohibitin superfamily)